MALLSTVVNQLVNNKLTPHRYNVISQEGPLSSIGNIIDAVGTAKSVVGENSLSEYTRTANIQPRVIIEDTLRTLPNMQNILMTLTNIYAAYYLQAIALHGTINGVSVASTLDKFNPDRDASLSRLLHEADKTMSGKNGQTVYNKIGSLFNSLESFAYVLPSYNNVSTETAQAVQIAINNEKNKKVQIPGKSDAEILDTMNGWEKDDERKKQLEELQKKAEGMELANPNAFGKHRNTHVGADKAMISNGLKKIQDLDNLAVGRVIEVTIQHGADRATIPVAVRMRPMSTPRIIVKELISLGDIKQSWSERWHRMRSGELSFISDWIFQSDVIAHKRKLMALDKAGLYRELVKRRKNNKAAQITSGKISIGAAASFIVVTSSLAKEVELQLGQSLDNEEFRNRIFAENSAMMIVVVDTEWERIKTYTRGISGVADYSFKSFDTMGKGNGPDITEIMKAYTMGSNPRF